ncbi:MAG: hypothetical protein GX491_08150 [Chloroflexi bacterium]|nr:hypothetical protein [Chloroflexota bacterium]
MNQAFHLHRLQQIDTQIDRVNAKLSEIDRLLSSDESVRQANDAAKAAEEALRKAQQDLKEAEFAAREQQIKISQSESNLYSGRIHNPKELQDLQKEIASLKKHLAALEEKQLEKMLAAEEAEAEHQSAIAAQRQVQAAFMERSAGWLGQKDQLLRDLDRLNAERSAALTLVTGESLKIYDNLRKRKNGVAVTSAEDGSCVMCGGSIRPAEVQAARSSSSLMYCSSCGRILYTG